MKRLFLALTGWLLCLALHAQSPQYAMQYWFDGNYSHHQTLADTTGIWQTQMEISHLSEGFHTLYLHFQDTSGRWSSPRSFLFYHTGPSIADSGLRYAYWFDQDYRSRVDDTTSGTMLVNVADLREGIHFLNLQIGDGRTARLHRFLFYKLSATMADSTVSYAYWFDQDYNSHTSGTTGGSLMVDVAGLRDGFHTFNIQTGEERAANLQSYLFYKMPASAADSQTLSYFCWFDDDVATAVSGQLQGGSMTLDVSALRDGFHTLNLQLGSGDAIMLKSALFYKISVQDSADMALTYTCWFDQDYDSRTSGDITGSTILMDVSTLRPGFHSANLQLGGGRAAALQSWLFYKIPELGNVNDSTPLTWHYSIDSREQSPITFQPSAGMVHLELDVTTLTPGLHTISYFVTGAGGYISDARTSFFYRNGTGIIKYEYCLNGDYNSFQTINVPLQDTLQLVTLLPVDTLPIRSTCFHFYPNNGSPILYAKNDITFRFWNSEKRFIEATRQYVDDRVAQVVVADTLERDTTKVIPAPTGNTIHWFKLSAGPGDSLSFKTDRRCTMQLYAPSGEMVFHASADSVLQWDGCHARENGDYYLAVHDAENTGNISVSYQWIYKYAILAWDVRRVGDGGISTITFEGNGFESLDTVYLIKGVDTIPAFLLHRENNTSVRVAFNFENADTGKYNALFVFSDENLPKTNVVLVELFRDVVLTTSVSYPTSFLRGSTVTYTCTITNTGNMTAYNVPIYTYINTHTLSGVSRIKYHGLGLKSVIDGFTLDSLSTAEVVEIKEWAERMGDDHYFFKIRIHDSVSGDSSIARANYFYITMAPYETKTLILELSASESLDVWFTVPDTLSPLRDAPVTNVYSSNNIALLQREIGPKNLGTDIRDWYCCVREKSECMVDRISWGMARTAISGMDIAATLAAAGLITFQPELWALSGSTAISAIEADAVSSLLHAISTTSKVYGNVVCDGMSFGESLEKENKSVVNVLAGYDLSLLEQLLHVPGIGLGIRWAKHIKQTVESTGWGVTYAANTYLYGTDVDIPSNTPLQCMSFVGNRPECFPSEPKGGTSYSYVPVDPNEITGYIAESGALAVGVEQMQLPYNIEFENDSALATGMAHTVIVRDTMDGLVFDLESFNATSFTIGENTTVTNGQSFTRTVDMRPEIDVLAQVQLDYQMDTFFAVATWTFTSLDPMTLRPATADTLGFLAIGGTGEVDFSINRKGDLYDSALIDNRAWITFDNEESIATSIWRNIVDVTPPVSGIDSLGVVNDTITVTMSATDNLSGVWRYNVYGEVGDMWLPLAMHVPADTVAVFAADTSRYRCFRTTAIDSAGNVEPLMVLPPPIVYDTLVATVCDSFIWRDSTYTTSGDYSTNTITDTVFVLRLTVNNSTTNDTSVVACDNYYWNGETYTASGTFDYHTTNTVGCDSTATLLLTINNNSSTIETTTACDSYFWHDTTYTSSTTTPTYTTTNASGCDSVLTLHLTIKHSSSVEETVTACDSYTWHGTTYAIGGNGIASYTTPNVAGCDSIVTLNLSLNHSTIGHTSVTACDSFTWGETTYTSSGEFNLGFSLTNAEGCDSTAILHLTVLPSAHDTVRATICDNGSYLFEDSTYTTSGTWTWLATSQQGCDSLRTLILTVQPTVSTSESIAACDSWQDFTTDTTLIDTLATTYGCDSIHTMVVNINYSVETTVFDSATSEYTWHGEVYTESGTYTWTGTSAEGCDSTVTLTLTISSTGIPFVEGNNSGLDVYPNPTSRLLTVIADDEVLRVEVYDLAGRKVKSFDKTNIISLDGLPSGSYTLKIQLHHGAALRRVILR